jgi:hypothetical protein
LDAAHRSKVSTEIFAQNSKDFTDTPRLRDAATRRVRRRSVEDLRDAAHSRLAKMRLEPGDQPATFRHSTLAPHANESCDVGTQEPRPDGSLMVGPIALARRSDDARHEARIIIRQRAQADRRQELSLDDVKNSLGMRRTEQRMGKTDREDLIRPNARIAAVAVNRVLLPVFADPNDKSAISILERVFPERRVIPIDCRELIWGLGTFHCLTQQQPAV